MAPEGLLALPVALGACVCHPSQPGRRFRVVAMAWGGEEDWSVWVRAVGKCSRDAAARDRFRFPLDELELDATQPTGRPPAPIQPREPLPRRCEGGRTDPEGGCWYCAARPLAFGGSRCPQRAPLPPSRPRA